MAPMQASHFKAGPETPLKSKGNALRRKAVAVQAARAIAAASETPNAPPTLLSTPSAHVTLRKAVYREARCQLEQVRAYKNAASKRNGGCDIVAAIHKGVHITMCRHRIISHWMDCVTEGKQQKIGEEAKEVEAQEPSEAWLGMVGNLRALDEVLDTLERDRQTAVIDPSRSQKSATGIVSRCNDYDLALKQLLENCRSRLAQVDELTALTKSDADRASILAKQFQVKVAHARELLAEEEQNAGNANLLTIQELDHVMTDLCGNRFHNLHGPTSIDIDVCSGRGHSTCHENENDAAVEMTMQTHPMTSPQKLITPPPLSTSVARPRPSQLASLNKPSGTDVESDLSSSCSSAYPTTPCSDTRSPTPRCDSHDIVAYESDPDNTMHCDSPLAVDCYGGPSAPTIDSRLIGTGWSLARSPCDSSPLQLEKACPRQSPRPSPVEMWRPDSPQSPGAWPRRLPPISNDARAERSSSSTPVATNSIEGVLMQREELAAKAAAVAAGIANTKQRRPRSACTHAELSGSTSAIATSVANSRQRKPKACMHAEPSLPLSPSLHTACPPIQQRRCKSSCGGYPASALGAIKSPSPSARPRSRSDVTSERAPSLACRSKIEPLSKRCFDGDVVNARLPSVANVNSTQPISPLACRRRSSSSCSHANKCGPRFYVVTPMNEKVEHAMGITSLARHMA